MWTCCSLSFSPHNCAQTLYPKDSALHEVHQSCSWTLHLHFLTPSLIVLLLCHLYCKHYHFQQQQYLLLYLLKLEISSLFNLLSLSCPIATPHHDFSPFVPPTVDGQPPPSWPSTSQTSRKSEVYFIVHANFYLIFRFLSSRNLTWQNNQLKLGWFINCIKIIHTIQNHFEIRLNTLQLPIPPVTAAPEAK